MVVNKKVIEKIKNSMKLNVYEARVWTALLSRGISAAGELAEISGVPRSRCYDVLESLEKKGFVFMKIGKPIKYIAIAPEEVMQTIRKQTRIEENRLISLFDSFRKTDMFDELQTLYSTGINYINSDEISSSIVGRQNINLFLKDMCRRSSGKINIHTDEKGLRRKMKVLKKAGCRKADVTIHAPVDNVELKDVKVRKSDRKIRMVNVDDEILLFTSDDDAQPDNESAVWMKSRFVTDTVKSFIE